MSKLEVDTRPAVIADAAVLAPRLRKPDLDEIRASYGADPELAIRQSIRMSEEATVGTVNGEPACVFGVAPRSIVLGGAAPWLMTTPLVERARIPFLRANRDWVRKQLDRYKFLVNHVDARNTAAIAWLRWLGFELEEPAPFGVQDLPFHRFTMRSYDV